MKRRTVALAIAVCLVPLSAAAELPQSTDDLRDRIQARMVLFDKQVDACDEVAEATVVVRVKFEIAPSGKVVVQHLETDVEAPRAVECVRKAYQQLSFENLGIQHDLPVQYPHRVKRLVPDESIDLFDE